MSDRPGVLEQRLQRHLPPSYDHLKSKLERSGEAKLIENAVVDCGWGRLIMGQTFRSPRDIAEALLDEDNGRRDIALHVSEPHIVLSYAPQNLFLDPSDTYRLWLNTYRAAPAMPKGFIVRRVQSQSDAHAMNGLYIKRGMVPTDINLIYQERTARTHVFLVAEDCASGQIIGTVMGINHQEAFNDPEAGSSLWCLAVDPQARYPGVGEALVRQLAEYFQTRGLNYMDLSVMHDNRNAKRLYEKLGFQKIQTFAVKNKNLFNARLFLGPQPVEALNPYARILVDEALARGIMVNVLDAEEGYFELSSGIRKVVCRESLTELTSAIAMSRCQNKHVTHRLLQQAGLSTPAYRLASHTEADEEFLHQYGTIVVKPDNGEQGEGVTVGIRTPQDMRQAIERAQNCGGKALLESFHAGQDLRVVVIGYEVVAAAIRRPAEVVGDGRHSIRKLIEKQSRRRSAATGGESKILIDDETLTCVEEAGFGLDTVLPAGRVLPVKKAANLHKGGTIHDVTDELHPALREAAITAATTLGIPVVGLDFMVPSPRDDQYVIIEANERPGLANHEPQPTARKFIDLLFPYTVNAMWEARQESNRKPETSEQ